MKSVLRLLIEARAIRTNRDRLKVIYDIMRDKCTSTTFFKEILIVSDYSKKNKTNDDRNEEKESYGLVTSVGNYGLGEEKESVGSPNMHRIESKIQELQTTLTMLPNKDHPKDTNRL